MCVEPSSPINKKQATSATIQKRQERERGRGVQVFLKRSNKQLRFVEIIIK